jgi:hypothetical protein
VVAGSLKTSSLALVGLWSLMMLNGLLLSCAMLSSVLAMSSMKRVGKVSIFQSMTSRKIKT